MGFFDSFFGGLGSSKKARDLLITDVTRMDGDKVCIAALDGGKAVRLNTPQPRESWIESLGGLAPGDQLSAVWRPAKRYTPPHMEDGGWVPASAEKTGSPGEDALVRRLGPQAFDSVAAAFGSPAYKSARGNPAFSPGRGSRSLATLRARRVTLRPAANGVRADLVDHAGDVWKAVPVVDLAIRVHQQRCPDCRGDRLAENLMAEFAGSDALLRIGLGRAYQPDDEHIGCYLQVNHVFLTPSRREHFVLS